jgi:hypothetical protein
LTEPSSFATIFVRPLKAFRQPILKARSMSRYRDAFRAFRMKSKGTKSWSLSMINPAKNKIVFMIKKFFQNTKKNSDSRKRIGMICTLSANMDRQHILMLFLLQDCSEEVFDTRKLKVKFLSGKDRDSSSIKNKLERSDVFKLNIFDSKNVSDVLGIIKKESDKVVALILTDAEKRSSAEDQEIFGSTLGDQLGLHQIKYEGNSEQLYLAARKTLLERKHVIEKCLKEFKGHSSEKGIAAKEDALTFAGLKSRSDINLIHLIGHQALNEDIVFQTHLHENVITFGKRAKKYLPAILKKLLSVEPTTWLEKNGIIYSEPNRHTMISFDNMMKIIEKTVREFDPGRGETMPVTNGHLGNHMPESAKHNGHTINHKIQTDTAMAEMRA